MLKFPKVMRGAGVKGNTKPDAEALRTYGVRGDGK